MGRNLGTHDGFVALVRPIVGQDLFKVGEALEDLSDLFWHVNWLSKMLKLSESRKRKEIKGPA